MEQVDATVDAEFYAGSVWWRWPSHNTMHGASRRSTNRLIVAGAAAGLLAWLYDYNFFLNAGGPATPMSMAILRASHLQQANVLVFVLWPLGVLMGIGAALGFVLARLLAHSRSS